jgi:hypothetical protein
MAKYLTITSIVAPVDLYVLERAEELTILGEQGCDIDESGVDTQPVDAAGNMMGAIVFHWHEEEGSASIEAEDFLRDFSTEPFRSRKGRSPIHSPVLMARVWNGSIAMQGRYSQLKAFCSSHLVPMIFRNSMIGDMISRFQETSEPNQSATAQRDGLALFCI